MNYRNRCNFASRSGNWGPVGKYPIVEGIFSFGQPPPIYQFVEATFAIVAWGMNARGTQRQMFRGGCWFQGIFVWVGLRAAGHHPRAYSSICLRLFFLLFSHLVVKGIDHYWKYCCFQGGLCKLKYLVFASSTSSASAPPTVWYGFNKNPRGNQPP